MRLTVFKVQLTVDIQVYDVKLTVDIQVYDDNVVENKLCCLLIPFLY